MQAALPRPIVRGFVDAQVPLYAVALVVQEIGAARPLFAHEPDRPMNPASVMKLVTSFAALELLGVDYRWRTEAYLDGTLDGGILHGDLVLKGHGDPKITVEQWQSFMAQLQARGLHEIDGDLVLDRSHFAPRRSRSVRLRRRAAEALQRRPGRDAGQFQVGALRVRPERRRRCDRPARRAAAAPRRRRHGPRRRPGELQRLARQPRRELRRPRQTPRRRASPAATPSPAASATGGSRCSTTRHYVHGMFETYFREAGGRFGGQWRNGTAPARAAPFAVLESAPLYDIVRDINKLSNNVMARQVFLTLATTHAPPPATTAKATAAVHAWLAGRKLRMPELGSTTARDCRAASGSAPAASPRLLRAADASKVRDEFASSLAVAAIDGTLQRRFQNGTVAGQALLKTGSLEGVRAIAGYVIDAEGRRWIVVALINHANAVRGQPALDTLVQWVYANAAGWSPTQRADRRRGGADASRRRGLGAVHAGYRPAVLEQQVAADHPVEHPERGHAPDAKASSGPSRKTMNSSTKMTPPTTPQKVEYQNVRISQRRCEATQVPSASSRFT